MLLPIPGNLPDQGSNLSLVSPVLAGSFFTLWHLGSPARCEGTHIPASGPITSWQIDGETVANFILRGAPKSLQMVIAAMKLKDAYSLEGKL